MPPGYKSPTPIPPEHQAVLAVMGGGNSFGRPAIQPQMPTPGSTALPVSEQDVRRYIQDHKADQRRSGAISDGEPQLLKVEQTQLIEVYRRYLPVVLSYDHWIISLPPETPVYIATLRGNFRVIQQHGPPTNEHPVFSSGVMIFDAHTGYELIEGGVGRIDTPEPKTPAK
jgi:hypothetical protein